MLGQIDAVIKTLLNYSSHPVQLRTRNRNVKQLVSSRKYNSMENTRQLFTIKTYLAPNISKQCAYVCVRTTNTSTCRTQFLLYIRIHGNHFKCIFIFLHIIYKCHRTLCWPKTRQLSNTFRTTPSQAKASVRHLGTPIVQTRVQCISVYKLYITQHPCRLQFRYTYYLQRSSTAFSHLQSSLPSLPKHQTFQTYQYVCHTVSVHIHRHLLYHTKSWLNKHH